MAKADFDKLLSELLSSQLSPKPASAQSMDFMSSQTQNGVDQPQLAPVEMDAPPTPSPMPAMMGGGGPSPDERELRKRILAQFEAGLGQRRQGLEADKKALSKEEAVDPFSQVDLSPLHQFAAFMGGDQKAAEMYKAPKSNTELKAALRDKLASHQGAIADDELNLLKFQLMNKAQDQQSFQAKRLAIQEDRMDRNEHMKAVTALNSNKALADRANQYQNLDNALAILTKAKHITPQTIHEFQQAVRSNLGIKGTSGVAEREGTYLNSLDLKSENWAQFLTGDPASIARDNKIVQHIQDLAAQEQAQIQGQYNDTLSAVSGGRDSMYARRPDLKSDLDKKIKSMGKRVGIGPAKAEAKAAPAPSGGAPMSQEEFFKSMGW